jgi:hypothetical protein
MTDRAFVCPFCPLHCDDLRIEELAERCDLFAKRLSLARQTKTNGPSYESSLATAAGWTTQAKTIAVTGTIVDLETARAVCDFVERSGANLFVGGGPSDGFSEAIARDGIFSITLGDAAAPHQQVVMIGDSTDRLPRLRERLKTAGSIYSWQSTENLVDRLASLRLMLKRPDLCQPGDDQDLAHTLNVCQKESAVVFAIDVSQRLDGQQRPFWSTLQGLLSELNRRIRASVLRFDNSMTLRSVAAWSSDGPHPSAAAIRVPVDLEIRFSPWPAAATASMHVSEPFGRRRITIGCAEGQSDAGSATAAESCQSIHLPAAMPGIASDGIVIRGDGSVTLPLSRAMESDLPTAAMTLSRLFA